MAINPARKAGYYTGYNDGINAGQCKPSPDLVMSLSSDTYMETYLSAYMDGFDQGCSDRRLLLQGRQQDQEWELARNSGIDRG